MFNKLTISICLNLILISSIHFIEEIKDRDHKIEVLTKSLNKSYLDIKNLKNDLNNISNIALKNKLIKEQIIKKCESYVNKARIEGSLSCRKI